MQVWHKCIEFLCGIFFLQFSELGNIPNIEDIAYYMTAERLTVSWVNAVAADATGLRWRKGHQFIAAVERLRANASVVRHRLLKF